MMITRTHQVIALIFLIAFAFGGALAEAQQLNAQSQVDAPLNLLFLGDKGHHQPARRAAELIPVLAERGIKVQYTDDVNAALSRQTLDQYDGLIVYANIDQISDPQAEALLSYVSEGGGFIPLHCASYCFRNNPDVVALIGAQFQRHGGEVFSVKPTKEGKSHPLLKNYSSFESWDETYVHTLHNTKQRLVLEQRPEGDGLEPWTWIRTHGEGRVFYTAWGHDQRTFNQPGFHNLVERGIRWACGQDPTVVPEFVGVQPEPLESLPMKPIPDGLATFEYIDVGPKIPNYAVTRRWGEQKKPLNLMQKPLSPEESMKHYSVPEGFELSLFAAEPGIGGKPICMAWDHRGRLWVAETYDYPNEKQPEGKGRDRIRICEDTNGDGKADTFTVFADGLSIPTSIAFSHGGLIVHQAPQTLFLQDTDGDDVADVKKVLFDGWSVGDTHAGPSNLNYGHDNWFYGIVGYAGFQGTIAGQKRSFRTGFYRFQVDKVDGEVEVTDFEFLRNTNNNSWGVGLNEQGLLFGSTANRNPSEFMPIANRYYEQVRGWTSSGLGGIADNHLFQPVTDKVRQVDHHGGYTAGAGHAIYTARRYPESFWNRTAFVAGPTGHLVGVFALTPDGAGYRSTSPMNLVASDDEWAAPIMAEVGPDGNVWVIDWYNYIVQHNPTPAGFRNGPGNAYMTELRDKKHGRIYRVSYGEAVAGEPVKLDANDTAGLVAALKSTNLLWRRHAQRLLIEQGRTEAIPQLLQIAGDESVDSVGLNTAVVHALRTLNGLQDWSHPKAQQVLLKALKHASPAVVRTAVEIMPRSDWGSEQLIAAGCVSHPDAQVKLAVLLALSEMPASPSAGQAAVAVSNSDTLSRDRWLREAAVSAAATNAQDALSDALSQESPVTAALVEACRIVAQHMARDLQENAMTALLPSVAKGNPEVASAIINGWSQGWPKEKTLALSDDSEDALVSAFDALPPAARSQLVRLGQTWGSERLAANAQAIAKSLLAIVEDEVAAGNARIDAAQQYIALLPSDCDAVEQLLQTVSARTPKDVAAGVIGALKASRCEQLAEGLLGYVPEMTPANRSAAMLVLLSRPASTESMLNAMQAGKLTRQDLALDQQQALLSHPNETIRRRAAEVLAASGGLPNADRQKLLESMLPLLQETGDVARGKLVFTKNCANCHMHRGEGKKVGPDLTGMAVHPKLELLTHVIDPSRSVEGNYRSYSVLTIDGIVITGMLASETQTAIEIFDAQGKKHVILRDDIESLKASPKSVMPEGFEKQIDNQGFIDLLEFLTDKGQYLPLPIDKVATAISTKGLFHAGDEGADRLVFADWSPKMVNEVPFQLIDPRGKSVPNLILLHGPQGSMPPKMPKSVRLPVGAKLSQVHLLSGVSGWGFPAHNQKSVSMTVRLHLADGSTEDHELVNGVHFADYIRRVDVPGSTYAMSVRGQQLRYIAIDVQSDLAVKQLEFVKGNDPTAPIVMAVTIETAQH